MRRLTVLAAALTASVSQRATAGGFFAPSNGAEALGRGGAFVAKADNATALEYNVGGLARIRGTHLLLEGGLHLHSFTFSRAGTYPGPINPSATGDPFAGTPYPTVSNGGGPGPGAFLGIVTDFGYFERWTFAIGAFAPAAVGNRSFSETVTSGGVTLPSPARYDLVKENLIIVIPTLAAAVRATRWLDVGLALHVPIAKFELANVAFADLGRSSCPSYEFTGCDALNQINTTGVTATFSIGLMARPKKWLALGASLTGPTYLNTSGTVKATPPRAATFNLPEAEAQFNARLPWIARFGVRYIFNRNSDGREVGDIELDGFYEAWNEAEGVGDQILIPQLGPFRDVNPIVPERFRDLGSLRLGGAYALHLAKISLHFRLGAFWESEGTRPRDTRLAFDTMMKVGPTVGLGFTVRGVTFNVGYLYSWSPTRTVTDGRLRPINGIDGSFNDVNGDPLPAINNGTYTTSRHQINLGLNLAWDDLLKKKRSYKY